jgi:glutamine phosphoribosylpyrophosphate amidotransferase
MPSTDELVAARFAPEQLEVGLADQFRVDSVTFLPVQALRDVAGEGLCTACFTGDYIVPVSDEERRHILHTRQATV